MARKHRHRDRRRKNRPRGIFPALRIPCDVVVRPAVSASLREDMLTEVLGHDEVALPLAPNIDDDPDEKK